MHCQFCFIQWYPVLQTNHCNVDSSTTSYALSLILQTQISKPKGALISNVETKNTITVFLHNMWPTLFHMVSQEILPMFLQTSATLILPLIMLPLLPFHPPLPGPSTSVRHGSLSHIVISSSQIHHLHRKDIAAPYHNFLCAHN